MKIRNSEHYPYTLKGYHFVKEESKSVQSKECMLFTVDIIL